VTASQRVRAAPAAKSCQALFEKLGDQRRRERAARARALQPLQLGARRESRKIAFGKMVL
jgi:hypothetical protein